MNKNLDRILIVGGINRVEKYLKHLKLEACETQRAVSYFSLVTHFKRSISLMAKQVGKDVLVEAVAKVCDSKKQAMDAVNAMLDAVTKTLSSGQKIVLTGFGSFSVSKRAARMGVNPRTGKRIKIAATKVPKFKAGKALKDAVK